MDRFLSQWQGDDSALKPLQELKGAKLFPIDYAGLSKEARSQWVAMALGKLSGTDQSNPSLPAKTGVKKSPGGPLTPDQPAATLRSVTSRLTAPLRRMGIGTLNDLIYLFPRRHNEIVKVAQLQPGEEQTIVAALWESRLTRMGRTAKATEADFGDETGNIHVVWFNQPYIAQRLKPGTRYVLSGRVSSYRGRRSLDSPHHEELRPDAALEQLTQPDRLFPVYPLTDGITQQTMRRVVREALARGADGVEEALPEDLRRRNDLLPVRKALWDAHYPDNPSGYEAARRRLAFEELLRLQLGVLKHRKAVDSANRGVLLKAPTGVMEAFLDSLPFQLTAAQRRVLDEVLGELAQDQRPMSRLLQGEVGSGKTVVALAALLIAATCGHQGAIMAPTEVLAEQHFSTVARLLAGLAQPLKNEYMFSVSLDPFPRPITVGLLIGAMPARRKREVQGLLADGSLDIAIGTHALVQEDVDMPRLAMAVVDEQHRFGVLQRAALRQRGNNPHLLLMSATPIPRTLALTLYGDLDLSTIDELPPGRQPIRTKAVGPERRTSVYGFLRKEVQAGRQAFVIYPLIDESEAINARAAVKERGRLADDVFPDLRVGLLHGRMPSAEKQEVMDRFRQNDLDILVSTPVVEVGIDIPNATVMLIEGADRFGLAQLHQFRGRVGRGQYTSYCILVAESPSEEAKERLSAMESIDDGFKLAEVDLQLRGPGDYFGTRQSGLPDLRMARLSDVDLLSLARREAQDILDRDPDLTEPEHQPLKQALVRSNALADGESG